jgi:hypothetical protein
MPRSSTQPPQAKVHLSYLADEVAALYGCHRNTVTNWVSEGLEPIDERYTMMFHGTTLNDFHRRRRSARKRPCGPGEIYCVVCHEPKVPAGGLVEYERRTDKLGTVIAICPQCDGLIRQAVGKERLGHFLDRYSVTFRESANVSRDPLPPAKSVHVAEAVSK